MEPNTNFLFKEKKTLQRNYEELRESLDFTESKIEEEEEEEEEKKRIVQLENVFACCPSVVF